MFLVINTSGIGIDLMLNDNIKHIDAEKQAVALPIETQKFLDDNNVAWSDLTAIAVVVGPGSFTGIRLGIAYAKGIALGLNIPVISINAFELYLAEFPDAFVAIDSGRGDFFVAAQGLEPTTMSIDDVETKQMQWNRTVGHKPFNLSFANKIIQEKINSGTQEPVIPMYLRPSYAEKN
ncbi:MAG: tRNA (adenosine(37)-N6)-threonylcarbamoyltransferase complex dimerization subunit type 1 TsaB [Alphaproteobacteria bacterium]